MDGFPERVSALCAGLTDEVREELNELKKSNTTLLRKVETLEKSQEVSDAQLEGFRLQLDEQEKIIEDAGTSLAELRAEHETLKEGNDEILRQHNALMVKIRKDDATYQQHQPPPLPLPPPPVAERRSTVAQTQPALTGQAFYRESSVGSSTTFHAETPRVKRTTLALQNLNESSSSEAFVDATEMTEIAWNAQEQIAENEVVAKPQEEMQDIVPAEIDEDQDTQRTDTGEFCKPQKRKLIASSDVRWLQKNNPHLYDDPQSLGRNTKRLRSSGKIDLQTGSQSEEPSVSIDQHSTINNDFVESNIVVKPRSQLKVSQTSSAAPAGLDDTPELKTSNANGVSATVPAPAIDTEAVEAPQESVEHVTKPPAAVTHSPCTSTLLKFNPRTSRMQTASNGTEQAKAGGTEENIAFSRSNTRPRRTAIKTLKAQEGFPKI